MPAHTEFPTILEYPPTCRRDSASELRGCRDSEDTGENCTHRAYDSGYSFPWISSYAHNEWGCVIHPNSQFSVSKKCQDDAIAVSKINCTSIAIIIFAPFALNFLLFPATFVIYWLLEANQGFIIKQRVVRSWVAQNCSFWLLGKILKNSDRGIQEVFCLLWMQNVPFFA